MAAQTGLHYSTISRVRSQHRSNLPKALGGRPSKLSPATTRYAQRLISSGKADTAVDVAKNLGETLPEPISTQTIRRALKREGMKAVVKKKRPLLKPRHIKARMDFAVAHQDWMLEDWKRVFWSDETKINRLGSDGRKWGWKKEKENLNPRLVSGTVKFGGGSLMLWGCFGWDGVGYSCKIDGRMSYSSAFSIGAKR